MNNNTIIERINKLREVSVANGATLSEAEVAASKVADLMAKHSITELQLNKAVKDSNVVSIVVPYTFCNWINNLVYSVTFLYPIYVTLRTTYGSPRPKIVLNGSKANCDEALALILTLHDICQHYKKILGKDRPKDLSINDFNKSFCFGYAKGLTQKFKDIADTAMAETSDSTAIMVLKQIELDRIEAELKKSINLVSGSRRGFVANVDARAADLGITVARNFGVTQVPKAVL